MNRRRLWKNLLLRGVVLLFGSVVVLGALALVLYVLVRGYSVLGYEMLVSEPSLLFGTTGVMPAIANTLLMMVVVTLIAVPFGLLASMFFEYIRQPRLKAFLKYVTGVAAELPPVVYGLLGLLVFSQWLGMGVSVLAGSCTMAVMLVLDVMKNAEGYQSQHDIRIQRQAVALGASPGQLFYTVWIPQSNPYTAAGFLRAMARVAGETIALLLTLGAGTQLAESLEASFHQSGGTLSVMLYIYVQQRGDYDTGFAIAALLLTLVGILIVGSNICAVRLGSRWKR